MSKTLGSHLSEGYKGRGWVNGELILFEADCITDILPGSHPKPAKPDYSVQGWGKELESDNVPKDPGRNLPNLADSTAPFWRKWDVQRLIGNIHMKRARIKETGRKGREAEWTSNLKGAHEKQPRVSISNGSNIPIIPVSWASLSSWT